MRWPGAKRTPAQRVPFAQQAELAANAARHAPVAGVGRDVRPPDPLEMKTTRGLR